MLLADIWLGIDRDPAEGEVVLRASVALVVLTTLLLGAEDAQRLCDPESPNPEAT